MVAIAQALLSGLSSVSQLAVFSAPAGISETYRVGPLPWQPGQVPLDSYAGHIQMNRGNASMFFWYFPAQEPLEQDPPLLVWLQGGPGASSMIGQFYEMGPIKLTSDMQLVRNPYTWNKHASMVFVDSPVGTGFSCAKSDCTAKSDPPNKWSLAQILEKSSKLPRAPCVKPESPDEEPSYSKDGYSRNQAAISADLITFLDTFYGVFPSQLKSALYLTGESYAGKYIPALAYHIHTSNKARTESNKIPLVGLAIGDGFTDPATQIKTHGTHALALGLVSSTSAKLMDDLAASAVKFICAGDLKGALESRMSVFDVFTNSSGHVNFYDVRKGDLPYDRKQMLAFLASPETERHLNTHSHFKVKDTAVSQSLENDIMKTSKQYFHTLLDNNYRILLYQAQFDFRDGILSSTEWIESLKWNGSGGYLDADRNVWTVGGHVAGYVTRFDNLVRVEIMNAGHLAPGDQPEATKSMIEQFLLY